MRLDGSNPEELCVVISLVIGLKVDISDNVLYWTSTGSDDIKYLNLSLPITKTNGFVELVSSGSVHNMYTCII